jgi:hypothetical protein
LLVNRCGNPPVPPIELFACRFVSQPVDPNAGRLHQHHDRRIDTPGLLRHHDHDSAAMYGRTSTTTQGWCGMKGRILAVTCGCTAVAALAAVPRPAAFEVASLPRLGDPPKRVEQVYAFASVSCSDAVAIAKKAAHVLVKHRRQLGERPYWKIAGWRCANTHTPPTQLTFSSAARSARFVNFEYSTRDQ